jgi:hypothetical protein
MIQIMILHNFAKTVTKKFHQIGDPSSTTTYDKSFAVSSKSPRKIMDSSSQKDGSNLND